MEQRLRVVHFNNINRVDGGDEHFVSTIEEAKRLIQELAKEELKDESIIFNAFDLTVLNQNGEWETWYDDEGRDFNALLDVTEE